MYQAITREAVRSLKFARRYKIWQKENQTELILNISQIIKKNLMSTYTYLNIQLIHHVQLRSIRTTHPISIILHRHNCQSSPKPPLSQQIISSISTIKISISFSFACSFFT
ncbi:hypothetical protein RIR_jg28012.t1 [Rhizophagus irregularis DAOM 181602=DAOM 197198]|nr:hypothetical protein RIR_jg28012.t1 [Rhizophagus irregularis DAOM 181602=DAOM 197198]